MHLILVSTRGRLSWGWGLILMNKLDSEINITQFFGKHCGTSFIICLSIDYILRNSQRVKYHNFTWFPGAEILWKRKALQNFGWIDESFAKIALFQKLSAPKNYVKLRYFMQWVCRSVKTSAHICFEKIAVLRKVFEVHSTFNSKILSFTKDVLLGHFGNIWSSLSPKHIGIAVHCTNYEVF